PAQLLGVPHGGHGGLLSRVPVHAGRHQGRLMVLDVVGELLPDGGGLPSAPELPGDAFAKLAALHAPPPFIWGWNRRSRGRRHGPCPRCPRMRARWPASCRPGGPPTCTGAAGPRHSKRHRAGGRTWRLLACERRGDIRPERGRSPPEWRLPFTRIPPTPFSTHLYP